MTLPKKIGNQIQPNSIHVEPGQTIPNLRSGDRARAEIPVYHQGRKYTVVISGTVDRITEVLPRRLSVREHSARSLAAEGTQASTQSQSQTLQSTPSNGSSSGALTLRTLVTHSHPTQRESTERKQPARRTIDATPRDFSIGFVGPSSQKKQRV